MSSSFRLGAFAIYLKTLCKRRPHLVEPTTRPSRSAAGAGVEPVNSGPSRRHRRLLPSEQEWSISKSSANHARSLPAAALVTLATRLPHLLHKNLNQQSRSAKKRNLQTRDGTPGARWSKARLKQKKESRKPQRSRSRSAGAVAKLAASSRLRCPCTAVHKLWYAVVVAVHECRRLRLSG